MADIVVAKDAQGLAAKAASLTARALQAAIAQHGGAVWVLAGGTAPMHAYAILAREYRGQVEWPKVWVLLGDERCVPADDAEATWPQIAEALLKHLPFTSSQVLRPLAGVSAEDAAAEYNRALAALPHNEHGVPRFDVLWLGMGEDGHTLSLFPGQTAVWRAASLVTAVHNSPKPPPDRITLTLNALTNVDTCVVLTAGMSKAAAFARAASGDQILPIVQALQTVTNNGGQATWLVDTAAAVQISPASHDA